MALLQVIRWIVGVLLVALGIAGLALMAVAGGSDGEAPDTKGDLRWNLGCGALITAGAAILIFL